MGWDLLGHEWASDLLREHIVRGQVRHAYLLCGPPGSGRRTLALRFAQALNCPTPLAPGEPCRTCRTCAQIERMQHPDLNVLIPAEDGRSLKVEQIRQLLQSLALSPYQSPYRIGLLPNFENATPSAQNALLKTLEEAPERAILLLTAPSPEDLLPTIVSRCEIMRLRPLPVDALAAALSRNQGLPAADAANLAHLTGGRTGAALRLQADPAELAEHDKAIDTLAQLLTENRAARFHYARALSEDREKLHRTLQIWLVFWRDLLLRIAGSNGRVANLKRMDLLVRLAEQIRYEQALAQVTALQNALDSLDANANARLLSEALLLDWPYLLPLN